MRQVFLTAFIVFIGFSCGQADKKEKESAIKDTTAITAPDTGKQKTVSKSDTARTLKLTFKGYEEGDYPHLLFTETSTNTNYDFGHPEDNNLNNIPLVGKNNNTAFGYKENSEMKGSKFVADIVYKTTDTYDENGQPTIGKEWRIASLRKDE